jgi:hypothetical protein
MANAPPLPVSDEPLGFEPGPALGRLRPKWQAFVLAYVFTGNYAEAARRAGYSDTTPEIRAKSGRQLLLRPAVREAIVETSITLFGALAAQAVSTIEAVLSDKGSKAADRLRAADMVLSRVAPATTVHQVSVEHRHSVSLSAGELTRKLAELAARHDLALPPPIDAEYQEVEGDA